MCHRPDRATRPHRRPAMPGPPRPGRARRGGVFVARTWHACVERSAPCASPLSSPWTSSGADQATTGAPECHMPTPPDVCVGTESVSGFAPFGCVCRVGVVAAGADGGHGPVDEDSFDGRRAGRSYRGPVRRILVDGEISGAPSLRLAPGQQLAGKRDGATVI